MSKKRTNKEIMEHKKQVEKQGCPLRLAIVGEKKKVDLVFKEGVTKKEALKLVTSTDSPELNYHILFRAIEACSITGSKEVVANGLLQDLHDYKPKNSIEAQLVTKGHTLLVQAFHYLERAQQQDSIPQAEFFMKFAVKLFRLHNETILVLDKLRRSGEQKITVQHQHVNVGDGAKAAFLSGNFHTGGPGDNKKNNEVTS